MHVSQHIIVTILYTLYIFNDPIHWNAVNGENVHVSYKGKANLDNHYPYPESVSLNSDRISESIDFFVVDYGLAKLDICFLGLIFKSYFLI